MRDCSFEMNLGVFLPPAVTGLQCFLRVHTSCSESWERELFISLCYLFTSGECISECSAILNISHCTSCSLSHRLFQLNVRGFFGPEFLNIPRSAEVGARWWTCHMTSADRRPTFTTFSDTWSVVETWHCNSDFHMTLCCRLSLITTLSAI